MVAFIIGFIIAWLWSDSFTHHKIAAECERLGGFFVGSKTYKCYAVIDSKTDTSVPPAILEAEQSKDEI
ncbi:hypothetical protein D9K81_17845 [Acinetobacter chengduensis]|uniref:Uncharacterized protein n=1 Tax=Acinetobacter chengduensis TaxID=2420890 RepID=A0ABX9TQY1_9GAMM|nr:hypothetical protein D7V31_10455 [Acinetobacter sp. WCHAc060007]RLL16819.1 hypothetical protein D9K81_17845 [Acinetobacter chengduensis]